ncbi:Xaa-Pro aminopeptidase, partial [Pseudomonas syringae pv. tagetis]
LLCAFEGIGPVLLWNVALEGLVMVISAGLVELGVLRGDVVQLIESEAFLLFYLLRAGLWLGMDGDDVGELEVGGVWG